MAQLRLNDLLGRPVTGPSGNTVGRMTDVVVRLVDRGRPTVTGALVRIGDGDVFMSVATVASMDGTGIRLAAEKVDTRPFERRQGEVLLERDVRGRGVVDVDRGRLVRVGDLLLGSEGTAWHVVSILAARPADFSQWLRRLLGRAERLEEVPWEHVEPLIGHVPTVQRPLSLLRLAKLKPAEIADIVEAASHEEGEQILDAVASDAEFEADVFEELDETHRVEFLRDRSDEEAASVLSNMEPDHAADLVMQLPQERRMPVLGLIEADQQAKVRSLLRYGPETAGGLMNNEFVAFDDPDLTADEAIRRLRELPDPPAILTDVFVADQERLLGSIPLRDLVRAEPATALRELIGSEPEAVYPDADLPSVAVHMADYNLSALPVIDAGGMLIGIVTYDDLIHRMLPDDWRWRGHPAVAHLSPADNEEAAGAAD